MALDLSYYVYNRRDTWEALRAHARAVIIEMSPEMCKQSTGSRKKIGYFDRKLLSVKCDRHGSLSYTRDVKLS